MEQVVARGTWLSDGTVPTPVLVVRLDYDFWHAVAKANDDLEPGERPRLNAAGHRYYMRHKPGWSGGEGFWPDGIGYDSQDEAMAAAEQQVPSTVNWE